MSLEVSEIHSDKLSQGDGKIDRDSNFPTEDGSSKSFPQAVRLFDPVEGSNLPSIVVEDWTDSAYHEYHGVYLEDLAGTGICRVSENHPPCLLINGRAHSTEVNMFTYPKLPGSDDIKEEILFTDCSIGEVQVKDIKIENVGPYVVRFEWKRIPNYENLTFPIKFPPSQEQKFHMDSRPGVLLPGEKRSFGVGFRSKHTGIFKEDWEFISSPLIHTNKVVFEFRAIATEKIIKKPWRYHGSSLDRAESFACAREILGHIIRKVSEFGGLDILKDPPLVELETEDEVFVYVNHARFSYDAKIVREFKDLHLETFQDTWNLNVLEMEDWLNNSVHYYEVNKFIKGKIQMLVSEVNLLPRIFYRKYNAVYEALGDAMIEVQSAMDKIRQKFGFKPQPPIIQSEKPPYYYFPLSKAEAALLMVAKDDSKATSKKGAAGAGKTADKGKAKGKKREYIELIPKEPLIIRPTDWSPENQEYANEVFKAVKNILGGAIDALENILESKQDGTSDR